MLPVASMRSEREMASSTYLYSESQRSRPCSHGHICNASRRSVRAHHIVTWAGSDAIGLPSPDTPGDEVDDTLDQDGIGGSVLYWCSYQRPCVGMMQIIHNFMYCDLLIKY